MGGYEARDSGIMSDAGLEYRTYVIEETESGGQQRFLFSDGSQLVPCEERFMFQGIIEFVDANEEFVGQVIDGFSKHHVGGMYVFGSD